MFTTSPFARVLPIAFAVIAILGPAPAAGSAICQDPTKAAGAVDPKAQAVLDAAATAVRRLRGIELVCTIERPDASKGAAPAAADAPALVVMAFANDPGKSVFTRLLVEPAAGSARTSRFVLDGTTALLVQLADKQFARMPAAQARELMYDAATVPGQLAAMYFGPSARWLPRGQRVPGDIAYAGTETIRGEPCELVRMAGVVAMRRERGGQAMQRSEMTIAFAVGDHLPRRVDERLLASDGAPLPGGRSIVTFASVKADPDTAAARFVTDAPAGFAERKAVGDAWTEVDARYSGGPAGLQAARAAFCAALARKLADEAGVEAHRAYIRQVAGWSSAIGLEHEGWPMPDPAIAKECDAATSAFLAAGGSQEEVAARTRAAADRVKPAPKVEEKAALVEGQPAPALELAALDGNKVSLAELTGRVVVLCFGCASQPPSKRATLELQKLRTAHDAKDLAILYVECVGQEKAAQRLVESQRLTYPMLQKGEDAAKAYKITAYPQVVIVDRAGRIFAVFVPADAKKLSELVAKALQQ